MPAELSLFLDESGSDALDSSYYLLVVVMHEQSDGLSDTIAHYERALADRGLPNIPLHTSPLMNRKDAYSALDLATRKQLLSAFRVLFRHLPIRYFCIALPTKDYPTSEAVGNEMRRRLVGVLIDELPYLQRFDSVKIYYDNGQRSIAGALRKAIDYALSKEAVVYRLIDPTEFRLSQAADYLCTLELTALKYATHTTTATDEKFFGGWSSFKKGVLREARRKRLLP